MKFDCIIIGAGIAGLMTGFQAAKSGKSVAIFESRTIATTYSAGIVGALAPHMPENWNAKKAYQWEAFQMAPKLWQEISQISQCDTGFQQLGRLQAITSEKMQNKAIERSQAAKKNWEGRAEWIVQDEQIPFANAPYGTIFDNASAQIFPRLAVLALAKACQNLNVKIYENTIVNHIESYGILTNNQKYHAQNIIIAGGYDAWPFLRKYLGAEFGEGVKGQAFLIEPPQPWNYPMITGDGFYLVPHKPNLLGVGSTSETHWGNLENDFFGENLLNHVIENLPILRGCKILERWAGIRPRAYRPDPLIGKIDEGIFINAGGFKTGFAFAPKIALDLLTIIDGGFAEMPDGFIPKLKLKKTTNFRHNLP